MRRATYEIICDNCNSVINTKTYTALGNFDLPFCSSGYLHHGMHLCNDCQVKFDEAFNTAMSAIKARKS